MTQAANDNITRTFSVADLNTEIDQEPRVLDVLLGERLGMAQPRNLRSKIKENSDELSLHGKVCTVSVQTSTAGGRPGMAYYLNEPQALLICMFSNTARAAQVRKMLIDVFMEYRRSQGMVKVRAHERRTSTRIEDAIRLKTNIDRLERATADIAAIARPRYLTAMVVNDEPVVVDVHDFCIGENERAVVMRWNGELDIGRPVPYDGHRFAGERSAMLPVSDRSGRGEYRVASEGCLIVGKIIERHRPAGGEACLIAHEKEPRRLPVQYRGRRSIFRDEILRLLDTGLSNREIAQKTGATYQTVTHWRRWKSDREVA